MTFDMGEPLKPMEQLMAVLPPESGAALPIPFSNLMRDVNSPILHFYPKEGTNSSSPHMSRPS